MLLIGERLNTSRPSVLEAVRRRDEDFITREALSQYEAGARAIDINAAMLIDEEPEALAWLVEVVHKCVPTAEVCIDTPNPVALKYALKNCTMPVIINSISAEKERYKEFLPFILEYKTKVVALPTDDEGIRGRAEERYSVAMNLLECLQKDGVELTNVYLDLLVNPLCVVPDSVAVAMRSLELLQEAGAPCHFAVALSNVSFGLPMRKRINQAFLVMAMGKGVDTFILDPTDEVQGELYAACNVLTMNDPGGLEYISKIRKRKQTT